MISLFVVLPAVNIFLRNSDFFLVGGNLKICQKLKPHVQKMVTEELKPKYNAASILQFSNL